MDLITNEHQAMLAIIMTAFALQLAAKENLKGLNCLFFSVAYVVVSVLTFKLLVWL